MVTLKTADDNDKDEADEDDDDEEEDDDIGAEDDSVFFICSGGFTDKSAEISSPTEISGTRVVPSQGVAVTSSVDAAAVPTLL